MLGKLFGEILEASLNAIGEYVSHCDQLSRPLGRQGIGRCAGAAPATADQGDLDSVLLGGIAPYSNGAGQRCAGQSTGSLLEEPTTGGGRFLSVVLCVHKAPLSYCPMTDSHTELVLNGFINKAFITTSLSHRDLNQLT
ncbi:MAG: hypothetical protein ACYS80_07060 [Planctomycetota bacterium]